MYVDLDSWLGHFGLENNQNLYVDFIYEFDQIWKKNMIIPHRLQHRQYPPHRLECHIDRQKQTHKQGFYVGKPTKVNYPITE